MPAASKTVRPRKAAPAKTPAKKTRGARKSPAPKKASAKPAAKPSTQAAADKPAKAKQKLVRDGFTMPANDFALIDTLKDRLLGARRPTKKSELLRAGLHALAALSADKLLATVNALEPLKTGRPKKDA